MPLRSKDQYNLDNIAKVAATAYETSTEASFVDAKPQDGSAELSLKFDLVKRVIEVKLADERAAKTRAENKAEKEKLLKILAEKQDGKLSELSEKELQRRIAALGD